MSKVLQKASASEIARRGGVEVKGEGIASALVTAQQMQGEKRDICTQCEHNGFTVFIPNPWQESNHLKFFRPSNSNLILVKTIVQLKLLGSV